MSRIAFTAAVIFACAACSQQALAQRLTPTARNVKYGEHARNVLDVYKAESEAPAPAFIFFHGGGFVVGDKSALQAKPVARWCVENGVTAISANYRFVLGREGQAFPGPLMDGVRVVQFVRSKAKEWNIDPERIVVAGSSAGGLMAVWLGVHSDFAQPESEDPVQRFSSRVSGVIGYGAQTTIDPDVILSKIGGNPIIFPTAPAILGVKNIDEARRPAFAPKLREFSALTHVSSGDPPMQLHYRGDLASAPLPKTASISVSIHHATFGKLMQQQYEKQGVKAKVEVVCTDCSDPRSSEASFLKRVLKQPVAVAP